MTPDTSTALRTEIDACIAAARTLVPECSDSHNDDGRRWIWAPTAARDPKECTGVRENIGITWTVPLTRQRVLRARVNKASPGFFALTPQPTYDKVLT